jgi:hypothetical protein
MSAFGGLVLTTKGRNLQAKAQAGTQLNFTRIGVGDGELAGSSILELNALKHEVKTLNITKLKPLTGGKAAVGGMLSNQGLVSGFYWRELGLFATDPDIGEILYCYGNSGVNAEYIPADGGPDVLEKSIDIISIVGNAANVTATIDQSLVFATADDLNALTVVVSTKETPAGSQAKVDAHVNAADPHTGYIKKSLATAANDFLVASGAGVFVKKTLAEVKTLLGLGSAAYTASTAYATAAQGTKADNAETKASADTHKAENVTSFTNVNTLIDIARLAPTSTGTANALVIDTAGTFDRTKNGNTLTVIPNLTNTGAVTITEDGQTAKAIKEFDTVSDTYVALTAGKLKKNTPAQLVWSVGSDFFILRPSGGVSNSFVAGDNIVVNSATTTFHGQTTYQLTKAITVLRTGTVRVSFNMRSANPGMTSRGRIYKNGVAVGTERTTIQTSFTTYTEDFAIAAGDQIQLYTYSQGDNVYVANFQLKSSEVGFGNITKEVF